MKRAVYMCACAMDLRTSFHLFLSSQEDHPDNRPSDFQITLDDPIRLNGEWEAALQEITYVHSFVNMNQVSFVYERSPDLYKDSIETVDIPNDQSTPDLVHDTPHFHLTLNIKKHRMTMILKKDESEKKFFYCTKRIAAELGFKHHEREKFAMPTRDIHFI